MSRRSILGMSCAIVLSVVVGAGCESGSGTSTAPEPHDTKSFGERGTQPANAGIPKDAGKAAKPTPGGPAPR